MSGGETSAQRVLEGIEPGVFGKEPGFVVRSTVPWCGGSPLPHLVEERITPVERWFVRSHGAVPILDPEAHRVVVDGLVERRLDLGMRELFGDLPRHEVTATLQCAGNRRDELIAVAPIPGELPWGAEAVSTAVWSGISLADVLAQAGVAAQDGHVAFLGRDEVARHGHVFGFGGSIELARALAGDVLLADSMNGEPLSAAHGAPVRVVVPGAIGARSVKWLNRITIQADPSDNYFQAHAYKLLPADADPATVDWSTYPPLDDMQRGAVICAPEAGTSLAPGSLRMLGYATASGTARVASVEVSVDGGRTWTTAALLDPPAAGQWVRWQADVSIGPTTDRLVARMRDTTGEPQAPDAAERWNPKGYMNDAWHRIPVRVNGAAD